MDVLRQRTQMAFSTLNSHRVFFYTLVSTVAVSAAVANALKNHSNFYSVAIYLSKSSRSVLILANFGFIFALLCGRIVQQIFFGALRPNEVERLYDRLWFFITESLLAFTIFRDEFDIPFALMFCLLLFVKSFHWLAADRIEWMDQRPYPGPPTLFHVRMHILFFILWATDFLMFALAVENTLVNGVGGMVLFASEYAILTASVLNTISKYFLSWYEIRRASQRGGENAPPWENKSMWVFYIELATDFLKLTTYLIFFTIIITFYGLPLNIVRDVYITARSFITRLRALHRYQTATRNMDERYPNATAEEMSAMSDRTCIICREEMILRTLTAQNTPGPDRSHAPPPDGPNTTPKRLPCGHVFHFHCLRSWLERQQSCPTCRRTVLEETAQPHAPGVQPPPAAGPQQPNPFGLQGGAQQPPLNNPFGFVGRLFGAAAQPPNVPGQVVHGPFAPPPATPPANTPQMQNVGFGPGQQPPHNLVIQYHIQYQPARPQQTLQEARGRPQAQMRPQQQGPLPPQQFEGFQGPGGVWQPWGMDPRWFPENLNRQNPPANPPPSRGNTSPATPAHRVSPRSSPNLVSSTMPPPTPTPTVSSDAQILPQMPSSVEKNPTLLTSGEPAAREAAALAAMRRFGTRQSGTEESSPTPAPKTSTSTSEAGSSPVPSTSTPSTQLADSAAPPNSTWAPPGGRLEVPMMIPLYEHASPVSPLLPSSQGTGQSRTLPQQQQHYNQQPYFRPQSTSRPPSYLQHPQQQPFYGTGANGPAAARYQRMPRQPPVTQLPPTLTVEQLATMDRVTREAIDERLRVLEGVSGAVSRCIEDLMRMRSTLPVAASSHVIQPTSSGAASLSVPVTVAPSPTPTVQPMPSVPLPRECLNTSATSSHGGSQTNTQDASRTITEPFNAKSPSSGATSSPPPTPTSEDGPPL